ncbi:unnamed protein product [Amoebophrya sp. A120]|nr:unnamed protein product [Amoebophrya sp. A120]|eukprot:GSA120T00013716001.1
MATARGTARDTPLMDPTSNEDQVVDVDRVQLSVTSRTSFTSSDALLKSHRLSKARFVVLTMGAFMMFGSYYFFDQCSASEQGVREQLNITEPQFGLLQSVYSWPNMILPLFGGLLIDVFGIRKSLLLFMSLVFAGQVVYSLGLLQKSFATSLVGRVIFGLGGESLNVASLALVAMWFKGAELAFAMGIIICVSRLGSVAAFNSQEQLIEAHGVPEASFVGSAIMGFSFLNCLAVCFMDKRADKIDARTLGNTDNSDEKNKTETESSSENQAVSFQQILELGLPYWLITFCCVTVYISAFPFFQVTSVSYLTESFGFKPTDANFITSIPNLVSAFTSPLFGLFVDKRGKRPLFMICSTVIFMACFGAFIIYGNTYGRNIRRSLTADVEPDTSSRAGLFGEITAAANLLANSSYPQPWSIIAVYVALGGALCLFGAVMWPCIPLVVDAKLVGTAFGVTTAVQNLGLGTAPVAFTALKDNGGGSFTATFVVIIVSNALAFLAGGYLHRIDKTQLGEKLGKP